MPAIALVKHGPCLGRHALKCRNYPLVKSGAIIFARESYEHLPLVDRAPLDRGFEGSLGACMGIIECSAELIGEIVS